MWGSTRLRGQSLWCRIQLQTNFFKTFWKLITTFLCFNNKSVFRQNIGFYHTCAPSFSKKNVCTTKRYQMFFLIIFQKKMKNKLSTVQKKKHVQKLKTSWKVQTIDLKKLSFFNFFESVNFHNPSFSHFKKNVPKCCFRFPFMFKLIYFRCQLFYLFHHGLKKKHYLWCPKFVWKMKTLQLLCLYQDQNGPKSPKKL